MIDHNHRLALTKQAALLGISRGSVYYEPVPVSVADLALMRRLDELHLEFPFAGSRMLRGLLAAEGSKIGRRHVTTLMRRMGIEAIYRRPNTSKPAPGHRIYPYLLRGLTIDRPNHVWATDIAYIPMARGFVYLAAVMDWFARRVLAWRLSNTMEASFCIDAVEEALAKYGCPQIFNTDQGSQFTSDRFHPACRPVTASPSAWTARARGETTFSSSASGEPSSTRKSICTPMTTSAKHANRSAATSPSTTTHQNTHLTMLLKGRGFADRGRVLRGAWRCGAGVQRSIERLQLQGRHAQISKGHPARADTP